MSRYQHLTPAGEGSTHILTYNPVSGFTHISYIFDQFYKKKHLFFSHISQKAKFIQHIIIFLILKIIPTIKAYRISQYQVEI